MKDKDKDTGDGNDNDNDNDNDNLLNKPHKLLKIIVKICLLIVNLTHE